MKKRKIWLWILAAVLVIVGGITAVGAYLVKDVVEEVKQEPAEEARLEDVYHILLVGTDSRERGGSGRSDSMILLTVNEKEERIVAASIMRDIYLAIPGHGENRINAAYAIGGMPLLKETLKSNLDLEIQRYVQVDFFAFARIVDILGGVDMEIQEEEIPVMNRYIRELNGLDDQDSDSPEISASGMQRLDGKQALAYSRIRYVGNGDFERTERQRAVLDQIFQKADEAGWMETYRLLKGVLAEVTTDLSDGELWSLIRKLPSYRDYEMEQWRIPAEGTYTHSNESGMAVLKIDLEANKQMLKEKTENVR